MKSFVKPVALLLLILLSVNAVAGVQMITDMALDPLRHSGESQFCHSLDNIVPGCSSISSGECCGIDCANCVVGSALVDAASVPESQVYRGEVRFMKEDSITAGFFESLYRPPISN